MKNKLICWIIISESLNGPNPSIKGVYLNQKIAKDIVNKRNKKHGITPYSRWELRRSHLINDTEK